MIMKTYTHTHTHSIKTSNRGHRHTRRYTHINNIARLTLAARIFSPEFMNIIEMELVAIVCAPCPSHLAMEHIIQSISSFFPTWLNCKIII